LPTKPVAQPEPAWTPTKLDNPHADPDKARRVEEMFAAIAPSYDLNNRVHSFGRDQAWRRAAVKMAQLKAADRVADVACGTGDLTFAFARALDVLSHPGTFAAQQVVGLDFTEAMLVVARKKLASQTWPWSAKIAQAHKASEAEASGNEASEGEVSGNKIAGNEVVGNGISEAGVSGVEVSGAGGAEVAGVGAGAAVPFVFGDALKLPLPDASVDVVSIAFGIRNVTDSDAALAEFYRVLRPGGRLIVLEFTVPSHAVMRLGYNFYCGWLMPRTASLIARDRSGAYKYLPRSVSTFASKAQLVESMQTAGFQGVATKALTFGIAACYRGTKPSG